MTSRVASDERYRRLERAIKRRHSAGSALIEVLHDAQSLFGHLDRDVLRFVARQLKLPPSRVYGVATFYHLFTLEPQGRHECVVCTGTACYVKGSGNMLRTLRQETRSTKRNGRVTLAEARCVGACGSAPVVVVDGEIRGHQSGQRVASLVREWLNNDAG